MMDILSEDEGRRFYLVPGPRWLVRLASSMVVITLMTYVYDLYCHRWAWAIGNGVCVLINAGNAYFNTLPLYERVRLIRKLRFR